MNIYDYFVKNADGEMISMKEYKGKVLLIMNSATGCGFTPQYDDLQTIYEKYHLDGFEILDFPCNQFENQAPGELEDIIQFCDAKFGVTFPIFSKISVNGDEAEPLFEYLKSKKGFGGFDEEHPITPILISKLERKDPNFRNNPDIKWNFTKFLVDRKGNVVERFEPTTDMDMVKHGIQQIL